MSNKKRIKTEKFSEKIDNVSPYVTDSEDEYDETDRNLLKEVRTRRVSENYDSDDEVYKLQDDSDKDDEDVEESEEADSMKSDVEGLEEDYDLPNERAWGKAKRAFYSTDYVDPDYTSVSERNQAIAELEEEEARNIQRRLAEQLDDADFGLDLIQAKENITDVPKDDQIVKTDLTKLSKRQKQELIEKESPELKALINDFKDRLIEAKNILAPFLKLVENGICPDCPAVSFVRTKYHLILNYCVNISFYLMLKAKRLSVNSHPVIKRLAQYRQLLNQLEAGQGNLLDDIQCIMSAKKNGIQLYNTIDGSEVHRINKREVSNMTSKKLDQMSLNEETNNGEIDHDDSEEDIYEMDNDDLKAENPDTHDTEENKMNKDNMDEVNNALGNVDKEHEKRAITYQIAKNKGLTPYRKKDQRNPRVKHRNKYRKAKIRRKGAVREVRKEVNRYDGEISGIKASVKKSIKLK